MMKILNSTNGQNNIILMVLFAVGLFFGVGEAKVEMIFIEVSALIMLVREISKGDRPGRFTGNVVSYLLSALVAGIPFLSGLVDSLKPLSEYLFSGGEVTIGALIGLLIPVINQIVFLFQEQPWKDDSETETEFSAGDL